MPNLHFIPCAPVGSKFEDDVFVATSEPHGEQHVVIVCLVSMAYHVEKQQQCC